MMMFGRYSRNLQNFCLVVITLFLLLWMSRSKITVDQFSSVTLKTKQLFKSGSSSDLVITADSKTLLKKTVLPSLDGLQVKSLHVHSTTDQKESSFQEQNLNKKSAEDKFTKQQVGVQVPNSLENGLERMSFQTHQKECKDVLCTEYLSEADWQYFKKCGGSKRFTSKQNTGPRSGADQNQVYIL